MDEYRVRQVVEEDGQLLLKGLPVTRGQEVEVIVRVERHGGLADSITVGELLKSDLIGLWADREDIEDSVEFARRLRERAQHRDWSDDASAGH